MKKILVFSLLWILLFACENEDKQIQFNVKTNTTFEVPADASIQTQIELDAKSLIINKSIFEDFNTSKDNIDKATIKDIKLNISSLQNINFDFLTDVELYIEATDLPKIRIAWLNNLQDDHLQSLNLEHLSDNLSEYIKNNEVKISLILLTDEVLTQPVEIEVEATFLVKAEVMGK